MPAKGDPPDAGRRSRRGGAIVNTCSLNGLCGVPQWALYAAAKAGVIALTTSAALEYARQGVRINALVGRLRAPDARGRHEPRQRGKAEGRAGMARHYSEMIAAGRIGRPEEPAEAALWLSSDAASLGHRPLHDRGWRFDAVVR